MLCPQIYYPLKRNSWLLVWKLVPVLVVFQAPGGIVPVLGPLLRSRFFQSIEKGDLWINSSTLFLFLFTGLDLPLGLPYCNNNPKVCRFGVALAVIYFYTEIYELQIYNFRIQNVSV